MFCNKKTVLNGRKRTTNYKGTHSVVAEGSVASMQQGKYMERKLFVLQNRERWKIIGVNEMKDFHSHLISN